MESTANIQKWEANILQWGEKAGAGNINTWEGHAWYYDGQRVFYQIADYFKDEKWIQYALQSMNVYRTYVLNNAGRIPGYRIFPHGLYTHFVRTGDVQSKLAIEQLSSSAAYALQNGGPEIRLSRETAFVLNARIYNHKLGNVSEIQKPKNYALGHLEQWNLQDSYIQPFMVALTVEALTEYLAVSPNNLVNIRPLIAKTLDMLWDRCWLGDSFTYDTNANSPTPDLNLLIAPAFAWAYKETKEVRFLERGDQIFNNGVDKAYLAGGKQFSQNYRWSFKYLEWVKKEEVSVPETPPPAEYASKEALEILEGKFAALDSNVKILEKNIADLEKRLYESRLKF